MWEGCAVFGYVKPYTPNLLVREHELYKATYCGLCRTMRKTTGPLSALSLSYDLVLLVLVRTLYEEDKTLRFRSRRCIAHPLKRRPMIEPTPPLLLAARVSALLSYYNLKDKQKDEAGAKRLAATLALPVWRRARKRAKMAELDRAMAQHLAELDRLEQEKCASPDQAADTFGGLLGDVFALGLEGTDARVAYAFGKSLGRFIYTADAAEDYEKDAADGAYNPYVCAYGTPTLTDTQKQSIHTALMLELTTLESALHLLPTEDCDALIQIIQNVVYEGLPRRIRFLTEEGACVASTSHGLCHRERNTL